MSHGRPGGLPLGDDQAHRRAGAGDGRAPASAPDDIDVFAPHQANLRIIESMAKRLGFPERTVIARDIVRSGNTSAASIPLALSALLESRRGQERRPGAGARLRRRASPSPARSLRLP